VCNPHRDNYFSFGILKFFFCHFSFSMFQLFSFSIRMASNLVAGLFVCTFPQSSQIRFFQFRVLQDLKKKTWSKRFTRVHRDYGASSIRMLHKMMATLDPVHHKVMLFKDFFSIFELIRAFPGRLTLRAACGSLPSGCPAAWFPACSSGELWHRSNRHPLNSHKMTGQHRLRFHFKTKLDSLPHPLH
jgi:hypothetical protein